MENFMNRSKRTLIISNANVLFFFFLTEALFLVSAEIR